MLSEAARRFAALPTAVKLFLILTAALLPIGVGLVWTASQGIRDADNVLRAQAEEQARLASQGRTPVYVALEQDVLAVLGVADPVKPEAKEAVAALRRMKVDVVMLTGDSRETAESRTLNSRI